MRVLVVTNVHHPEDSRIRARQVASMLDAGWQVTYVAPFRGYGVEPRPHPGLRTVDVARAVGRRRLRAYMTARRALRREGPHHDVVVLHDPELLLALHGLRLPPVIWDVHEDTAAAIRSKPWVPPWAVSAARLAIRRLERWAERNVELLLAEPSYQARFERPHRVVPNTVRVPADVHPPGTDEVVHVGSLTTARGARELIRLAELLRERTGGAVRVRLIGSADPATEDLLRRAVAHGTLRWDGYLPSAEALAVLPGALAGVSLLRDTENHRISMPTKVLEYMAHGVPVVATPLPLVEELVTSAGCGVVVPFEDPQAAADAVLALRADPGRSAALGRAGHAVARAEYDWNVKAAVFLGEVERVARDAPVPVG